MQVGLSFSYFHYLTAKGVFHQYHTALLLVTELYATPRRYYENRIWDCLDFVFELPASMDREDKMRAIFDEVVDKTQYYHSLRKVRAPKALEDGLKAASIWLEHHAPSTPTSAMSPTVQTALKQDPVTGTERNIGLNQMNARNFQGSASYVPETQYFPGQNSRYISQSPEGALSDSSNMATSSIPSVTSSGPFGGRLEIDWVSSVIFSTTRIVTNHKLPERMG
jgi:hypothetical protein